MITPDEIKAGANVISRMAGRPAADIARAVLEAAEHVRQVEASRREGPSWHSIRTLDIGFHDTGGW